MPTIKFVKDYKSIKIFNEIELPNFCLLIGINGAGKTHLLEAISQGYISMNGISIDEILYLTGNDFVQMNEISGNSSSALDEYEKAWNILNDKNLEVRDEWSKTDNNRQNIITSVFKAVTQQKKNFDRVSLPSLTQPNRDHYTQYKSAVKGLISHLIPDDGIGSEIIINAAELAGKPFHKVGKTTFLENIRSLTSIKKGFGSVLAHQTAKYYLDLQEYRTKRAFQNSDLSNAEINKEYQDSNGVNPIEFVNNLLEIYQEVDGNSTNIRFKFDDSLKGNTIDKETIVHTRLRDASGQFRSLRDLSSGEKILVSLSLMVFEKKATSKFPKAILLDEVDSVLHPSMTRIFQSILQDKFSSMEDNIVIVTSHAPASVVSAHEECIFFVEPGPVENKVINIDKELAIAKVSEGMFTFQDGLSVIDQFSGDKKLFLISEGKNKQYFEFIIEALKSDPNYSWLDKVGVVGHRDISSGALRALYDWCRRFNNGKIIIFVWDHDYEKNSFSDSVDVKPHVLSTRTLKVGLKTKSNRDVSNLKQIRGIENCFPEIVINKYIEKEGGLTPRAGSQFVIKNKQKIFKLLKAEENTKEYLTPPIKKLFTFIQTSLK